MNEWDVTITYEEHYPGETEAAKLLVGPIASAGRSPWSDRLTLGIHVQRIAAENAAAFARDLGAQVLAVAYGDDPEAEWPVVAIEVVSVDERERRESGTTIRERFVSTAEAAEMLGISPAGVRASADGFGGEKVGEAGWIFPRAQIAADAARRRTLLARSGSPVRHPSDRPE